MLVLNGVNVEKAVFEDEKTGEKQDYLVITAKIGPFKVLLSPKDKTSKEMLLTALQENEKGGK